MYFERDVWSENPAFPEPSISSATELLPGATHGEVVSAANDVAAEFDVTDAVALRAPLSHHGAVVAGVVAPLVAGASIVLPPDGGTGTIAVSEDDDVPEGCVLSPADASP
ncbi:hypothetical protein GRX66_10910 [Halobacterium sp. PCN9]|uniref:Uncharacterized protein n=1 Tax=Halobacterium bonnevillei TaxID=2692200 RepID=A0A6B0SN24_9EURY|nr:hypothetical protein [Halobacterium bonnevillei]